LVRGEAVEMPPPGEAHGLLCGWIAHLLWSYVLQRGEGAGVASNDTGLLVEKDPDTVRGPDVMLFAALGPSEQLSLRYSTRIPRLIAEVLSPHDTANKVGRRLSQYLHRGVPLVWVVDPEDRTVAVYRPGEIHKILDDTEELSGEGVLPELCIPVAQLLNVPGQRNTQS
jgi:Uma2 family endonuclease